MAVSVLVLPFLLPAPPQPAAGYVVVEFAVEGNARLNKEAVRAASGLSIGQTATRADFEAGCRRLMDTGMFRYVNYRYIPKSAGIKTGVALTLQVAEDTSLMPVIIDTPGVEEEQLWAWLRHQAPLIDKSIPGSAEATAYYARAIERFLRERNRSDQIVQVMEEPEGAAGTVAAVFRPAVLPRIAAVRFEGNSSLAAAKLNQALDRLAVGQEYTERGLRRLLEHNVRPLYEEQGRLRVRFPSITAAKQPVGDGVAVTVAVEEGCTYTLGHVTLSGRDVTPQKLLEIARFPQGRLANWKQVSAALERVEEHLHRDGYLAATIKTQRKFDEQGAVVHLDLAAEKGPQFVFGELTLTGLDQGAAKRARGMWKLQPGAPMNEPYIKEYLRAVLPELSSVRSLSQEVRVRPGTHVVDVHIAFR